MTRRDMAEFLRRNRRWVLAACLFALACAFAASHIPAPDMPDIGVGDKRLHLAGFFGLGTLFWATLAAFGRRRWTRAALVLTVLPAYAALDELTQPYFRRSCDFHDWCFDLVGTLCALLLAEAVWWFFSRRSAGEEARRISGK